MNKSTVVIIAVAVAVVAFLLGMLCMSLVGKGSEPAPDVTPDSPAATPHEGDTPDDSADIGNPEFKEKNVFFSPHTGSDETGDATQYSPVETLERAKDLAKDMTVADNEELVYLEYLMTVDVKTQNAAGVSSSVGGINMIPFTGSTDGYYFKGDIVGTGCDTQKYAPDGSVLFSARYLLKGTDFEGKSCSIFIENNGHALELCTPTIITDSAALAEWQEWELRAIVVPVGGGVAVNVYRIHAD